jgi:hypothetical protein
VAVTHTHYQVTWGGASAYTQTVTNAAGHSSSAITFNTAAIGGRLLVMADNQGTPAAEDLLEIKILYSTGDPDTEADTVDLWDTTAQAPLAFVLDCGTAAKDPARQSIPIDTNAKSAKIYASAPGANDFVVSAQVFEVRG